MNSWLALPFVINAVAGMFTYAISLHASPPYTVGMHVGRALTFGLWVILNLLTTHRVARGHGKLAAPLMAIIPVLFYGLGAAIYMRLNPTATFKPTTLQLIALFALLGTQTSCLIAATVVHFRQRRSSRQGVH